MGDTAAIVVAIFATICVPVSIAVFKLVKPRNGCTDAATLVRLGVLENNYGHLTTELGELKTDVRKLFTKLEEANRILLTISRNLPS